MGTSCCAGNRRIANSKHWPFLVSRSCLLDHYGTHWMGSLCPRETYYSHYRWGGPHFVRVTNINITQINIRPRNYAYARHAIIVPQNNFYTANNYRAVRITNINTTTIINNYRAAPIVNDKVIKNYSTNRQRFNFANVEVREKPHRAVLERINTNQKLVQQARREKGSVLQQQAKEVFMKEISREARIQQPKATNFIVPRMKQTNQDQEIRFHNVSLEGAARGN